MAKKHILKNTDSEVVLKVYTDQQGETIDISIQNELTNATEVYVAPTSFPDETTGEFIPEYSGSHVFITGIWWGLKVGKQLDITRLITPATQNDPAVVHGHYYLVNSGVHNFRTDGGFVDRVYAQKDIRLIFDGPGHCILRLAKHGWATKIETAEFGIYDDVTQVGS